MEQTQNEQEVKEQAKKEAQAEAIKKSQEAEQLLKDFAESILEDMHHLYSKNLSHAANLVLFKILLQSCASLGWRKQKVVQYIKDTYPRIKRSTDARRIVHQENLRNARPEVNVE